MSEEEDVRRRMIKAVKAGNVDFAPGGKKFFEDGGTFPFPDKPDFTVTSATVTRTFKQGFEVSWSTVSAGFGMLTIWTDDDGNIKADMEGMSKNFCKEVLAKLIDQIPSEA